jgi:hypothetical protein
MDLVGMHITYVYLLYFLPRRAWWYVYLSYKTGSPDVGEVGVHARSQSLMVFTGLERHNTLTQ